MNVFLLNRSLDFDLEKPLRWNEKELTQDLELNILFTAMASGDNFLFEVAKKTILSTDANDPDSIIYRQDILEDCLKNPEVVRLLYDISIGALDRRKNSWFGVFTKYPSSVLSSGIGLMQIFLDILKKLRSVADENATNFQSHGFMRFFTMLQHELKDDYFNEIEDHLYNLRFPNGTLISFELGRGNRISHSTLRKFDEEKLSWFERLFAKKPPGYVFHVHPRDESGARALTEINDKGINLIANALAQSDDHILHFFEMMRTELAFYIGCLNLHQKLVEIEEPVCFPIPADPYDRKLSFTELYDPCLALKMNQKVVGNDVGADGKNLIMITGANQGGKSTFLRSLGLAQLLMQSGMFVAAGHFSSNVCSNLFTHFKREEDTEMKSGKFDEELSRMSEIADHVTSNSMFLFNESFAATNEREGSEIARQIVSALLEGNMKVAFVTHLYELAHNFYKNRLKNYFFLRAEREMDASRTFKLKEGEPLKTSFGIDVYNKVFKNAEYVSDAVQISENLLNNGSSK